MIWYSCQRNDVRKALLAKVIIYIQIYPNPCFVLYIRSVASMTNNSQCKGFFSLYSNKGLTPDF